MRKDENNPQLIRTECQYCGKMFDANIHAVRKGHGKYCTKACSDKGRVSAVICKCLVCSGDIYATKSMIARNRHLYCSNKCRGIGIRSKPNSTCEICGKPMVSRPHLQKSGRGKYCSKACFYASEGNPSVRVSCKQCGTEFMAEYNQVAIGKGKYCSRKCKGAWMSENLVREKSPRWNPDKTDEQRIEQRNNQGYAEWRLSVFKRDKFTCQHCGYDKGATIEAHHIIPFSTDESLRTDVTNGITLCKKCHLVEHKRLRKALKGQMDFMVV